MPRSIVIVHGWSDDSKSFRRLAEQLEAWFGSAPTQIRLADWISLQDDVTYADLAAALDRAWTAQGLSRAPRTVDVVVHSTGALVLRDWLTRHFDPASAPVKRFLMLAPANFGLAAGAQGTLLHRSRTERLEPLRRADRHPGAEGTGAGLAVLLATRRARPVRRRGLVRRRPPARHGAGGQCRLQRRRSHRQRSRRRRHGADRHGEPQRLPPEPRTGCPPARQARLAPGRIARRDRLRHRRRREPRQRGAEGPRTEEPAYPGADPRRAGGRGRRLPEQRRKLPGSAASISSTPASSAARRAT